jgi:hypothetical protein
MSELTPQQQRLREQFEGLIGAAAPFLDLVLGVGDRISRIVEPQDHEYYPVRSGTEASMLRPARAPEDHPSSGGPAPDEPAGGRDADA